MNRQKVCFILSFSMAMALVLLISGGGAVRPAAAQPARPKEGVTFPLRPSRFPLENVTSLVAGAEHTCALVEGGVKCWGNNQYGQLGEGSGILQITPVAVVSLSSGVTALAAGVYHTCAVTTGGGVKCWGYNEYGQLGDGTFTNRPTPVDVPGLSSGITALAAGWEHTCALTNGGGVKCWGRNYLGQLGDGTRLDQLAPVDVTDLNSGVVGLAAGTLHTCAITNGGGVKCWGLNNGQLGDGTYVDRPAPVDVIGLSSGISSVAAGHWHTCALTNGGGVKCWGNNGWGQLGDGTRLPDRLAPVDVVGLNSGVTALSAGHYHTCAAGNSGGVKCWGANEAGQLGDGTSTNQSVPVQAAGLSSRVTDLAGGGAHTCARLSSGRAKCWGDNYAGQLGNNRRDIQPAPVAVLLNDVLRISAGGTHTCAVVGDRSARCWGNNASGQLGDGARTTRLTPTPVSGLSNVQFVAAGESHTCAVIADGSARCWGSNTFGQLGDGTKTDRLTPAPVSDLHQVIDVTVGGHHTCALIRGGGVKCWGLPTTGQIGDGSQFKDRLTPVYVSGLSSGVIAVTAGENHTCALLSSGGVKCWGSNSGGRLGNGGYYGEKLTPVDVVGLSSGVIRIAAGEEHTCALLSNGGVKCWGDYYVGETLKAGSTPKTFSPIPADVPGLSNIVGLTAGAFHNCALTTGGGVTCWDDNRFGQLGDGSLSRGVSFVEAGGRHTCALLNTHEARCWGDNFFGQLGNGEMSFYPMPVDVVVTLPVATLPGLVGP